MPQFSSDLIPDVSGRLLGLPDQRWDGNFRNLNVTGAISGNFDALAINRLTHVIVPYVATPVFPCAGGTGFQITLTGNVTSSTITGLVPGMLVAFLIRQDATGNRQFVWPTNLFGGATIGAGSNEYTAQLFYSDGVNLYAVSPGVIL